MAKSDYFVPACFSIAGSAIGRRPCQRQFLQLPEKHFTTVTIVMQNLPEIFGTCHAKVL
jgi:hypothetical protein